MYCIYCNTNKTEQDFYASRPKKCISCVKYDVKKNREKNKEYYSEYDKKRYQNDPRVKERHKRYSKTKEGKEARKRSRTKWLEKNAVKRAAHILVNNRLRDGTLVKPKFCECCGKEKKRINGHHDDYTKPLEVRWLCCKCHAQWHKENGEGKF